ncbi:hypothetical protein ABZ746_15650 [Streptomyces sp. NPDC020096]|jgi:hypothetical protein
MNASWAKSVVIAEPAPPAARLARYLTPKWRGLLADQDLVGVVVALLFLVLVGTAPFALGGAAAAVLAKRLSGAPIAETWALFDGLLAGAVAVSYALVARYGMRFQICDTEFSDAWRLATLGNAAWRSLPRPHRKHELERLRAMNAATRLLLIQPDDQTLRTMLKTHTDALCVLATTALADNSSPSHHMPAALPPIVVTSKVTPGIRLTPRKLEGATRH